MRNLKRALSLTLASVMLLGMMVVGAGAAGYKDVTDGHNVEAIEVLQAVGAMVGDEAGNFDPDANVNRAQIATIMSRLLDLKVEDFNAADIPFTDVPEWAVPFVAACYADGITSGVSATAYGSNNSVTAAQAALMMMKALGYFQYQDDFGQDWQLATIKQASEIGLFNGVTVDRTSALTRNDVAQMALNALKSNMVSFTGEVGSVYEVNGTSIRVGYKPEYTVKTSADPIYNRIDNLATTIDKPTGQYEMQLGEYLYGGDLKLESTTDVFGRPARYWEFDGKAVGTYVKEELLKSEYNTSVTGKTLYDLLGASVVEGSNKYDFEISIDGESDREVFKGYDVKTAGTIHNEYWPLFNETYLNRRNDANVGATGNGVLTQVFVDTYHHVVYISVINTYLAEASKDYDAKKDEVRLTVHGIDEYHDAFIKARGKATDKNFTVAGESFDIEGVKEGEFFLVTVADGEVQTMKAPEVLSGVEVSTFSVDRSLTTGGTKYDFSSTIDCDHDTLEKWTGIDGKVNLKDMTYDVYLDEYGYAIGVVEHNAPTNYLFITGIDSTYSNLSNVTLEANAIFLDGTMDTVTINGKKSNFTSNDGKIGTPTGIAAATVNRWYSYSVSKDGVYTVKLVDYGVAGSTGQYHEDRTEVVDYKHHNIKVDKDNDRYGDKPTDLGGDNWYDVAIGNDKEMNNTSDKSHIIYGEDDTVYLTAELDAVRVNSTVVATVIGDVENVTVGVDNVDIDTWDYSEIPGKMADAKPVPTDYNSYGVYALYNNKGYIIAEVVVGEDNGTSDNLVYVHSSSVDEESYDKATEEWTWTRKAIVDGEEVTLVEVDDSGISMLEKMNQDKWYRIRYNADGEVTKVMSHNAADHTVGDNCLDYDNDFSKHWELSAPNAWNSGKAIIYVTDYNEPTIGDVIYKSIIQPTTKTVLYHEGFKNATLYNDEKGHTLYMDTIDASGIRYTEDTKVVFKQAENNKWYTEFWQGSAGVNDVLDELHVVSKDNQGYNHYTYEISAVIEDGRATTIIVVDRDIQGQDGSWAEGLDDDVFLSDRTGMDLLYKLTRNKVTVHDNGGLSFEFTVQNKNNNNDLLGTNGYTADGTLPVVFDYVVWRLVDGEWTQKMEIKGADMTLEPGQRGSYKLWVGDDIQDKNFLGKDVSRVRVEITDIRVGTGTFTPDEGAMTIDVTDPDSQLVKIFANGNELNLDKVTRALEGSGTYTVNLAPGAYTLTAELVNDTTHRVAIAPATVTIVKDGSVNVTVTVTEIDNSISFTGSAVEGTNFTYVKNDNGTYTITAVNSALGVKAYAVKNCTVTPVTGTATVMNSTAFTQWTVTPDAGAETVTVKVNKMKAEFTGDKLVSVEVDPDAPADYSVGPRSRAAAGENVFFYVTFQGLTVNGVKNPTYTVASKPGEEGLFFGANFTAEMRDALIAALNDFTGSDMNLDLDSNVSQEDQDAWQGESAGAKFDMEVTGDEAPYTVTLIYNGDRPSNADIVKMFNEKLVAAGKEPYEGATVYPDDATGNKIYAADGTTVVATIGDEASYFVLVNGEKALDEEGNPLQFAKGETGTLKIPYTGTAQFLVNKADWTKGYAVNGLNKLSVTTGTNDLKTLTGNLELVDAYKLASLGNSLTNVIYNDGEETTETTLSSPLYIPTDGSVTFTGKIKTGANSGNNTHVKLTIGGKIFGEVQAVAAEEAKYTVNMAGLTSGMVTDGVIGTVTEVGAFDYTVYFGDTQITVDKALANLELIDNPSTAKIQAGNYLLKSAIPNGKWIAADGLTAVTVARSAGKVTVTGTLTANENGEIYLVPVTKVTFNKDGDADAAFIVGNDETMIADAKAYFVKVGETMEFAGAKGESFQAMAVVGGTGDTEDWWAGKAIPAVTDPAKGVAITVNQAVKDIALEDLSDLKAGDLSSTKVVTAQANVFEEENDLTDNEAANEKRKVEVTLTATAGYFFAESTEIEGVENVEIGVDEGGASTLSFTIIVSIAATT